LASSFSTRARSASLFWQLRTSLMNTDSPRIPDSAMAVGCPPLGFCLPGALRSAIWALAQSRSIMAMSVRGVGRAVNGDGVGKRRSCARDCTRRERRAGEASVMRGASRRVCGEGGSVAARLPVPVVVVSRVYRGYKHREPGVEGQSLLMEGLLPRGCLCPLSMVVGYIAGISTKTLEFGR
jgi:hypothetical protein